MNTTHLFFHIKKKKMAKEEEKKKMIIINKQVKYMNLCVDHFR